MGTAEAGAAQPAEQPDAGTDGGAVERGLDPAVLRLFIIDGSKALAKAIRATTVRRKA
jgi:hypothetical protein